MTAIILEPIDGGFNIRPECRVLHAGGDQLTTCLRAPRHLMDGPAPVQIPAEVRAFLNSCIDSIEQVEVLMLLLSVDRPWTTRAVSLELAVPDNVARIHLETLVARGLLHVTVGDEIKYRYAPRNDDLRRYAGQLAACYRDSPAHILRYVAAIPRRSVQRFADAFKLRDPE